MASTSPQGEFAPDVPEPHVVRRGAIVPLSELSDGSTVGDLGSGITGMLMALAAEAQRNNEFRDANPDVAFRPIDQESIGNGLTVGALPLGLGGLAARSLGLIPDNSVAMFGGLFGRGAKKSVKDQISELEDRIRSISPNRSLPPKTPGGDQSQYLKSLQGVLGDLQKNIRPGPTSSVPKIDGIGRARDRRLVSDHLNSNPHVRAIPGRQGFPTKDEQHQLAAEFLKNKRLPEQGPWGRHVQGDVDKLLAEQQMIRNLPKTRIPLDRPVRNVNPQPPRPVEDFPSLKLDEPRGPRQHPPGKPPTQQELNEANLIASRERQNAMRLSGEKQFEEDYKNLLLWEMDRLRRGLTRKK